jgi:chloride channel protein, CIC family
MASSPAAVHRDDTLRDFSADPRLLLLALMAVVAGAAGAVAAFVLLKLIAVCTNLAYLQRLSAEPIHLIGDHLPLWTIAIPVVGGLIVGLMARFGSEKIRGHGIPEAIEAILIGQSRIAPKVALLKPLSSAIAIGTGGPFGAEGPIIMTGGALGSLFAQLFRLSSAERKTLLVAGAVAGMTGVFGTPLAAILLAVELLLFEWRPRSFIPVAVAVVVAAVLRPHLVGAVPLFPYDHVPFVPWWGLGVCAAVGITAGLQSAILTLCLYGMEDLFRKLPIHWMWWPALGGIAVGIGGIFEPSALGVGYENIRVLLQGGFDLTGAIHLLLVKAGIWVVALSSGTSGGVLAPLLIMGGALGAIESHYLTFADAGFWALLGMAAILGGTMRVPLASTLFAAEITGNYRILLPLLVASVSAFAVTVLVMRRSILTERIARRGHHIWREYSIDPFLQTRVRDIMASPVDTLKASMRAADAVAFMTEEGAQRHKSYPVVDEKDGLIGILSRADVLRWTRQDLNEAVTVGDLASKDDVFTALADDLVGDLADRMVAADVSRVPILDGSGGKLVGLVARRDLLQVRARMLREEHERGRLLRLSMRKAKVS